MFSSAYGQERCFLQETIRMLGDVVGAALANWHKSAQLAHKPPTDGDERSDLTRLKAEVKETACCLTYGSPLLNLWTATA